MVMRSVTVLLLALSLLPSALAESAPAQRIETAILAGGCFWCIEADYEKLDGVLDVISGYTGGHVDNPTYKQVSAGREDITKSLKKAD